MEANRKKVQIHMLPSGKVMSVKVEKSMEYLWNQGPMVEAKESKYKGMYELQYLYFTSDEKIKDGDWFYNSNDKRVEQKTSTLVIWKPEACFKIIATTDENLLLQGDWSMHCKIERVQYPKPSRAFLEVYVEKGGIDEVWVDLDMSIKVGSLAINPYTEMPDVIKGISIELDAVLFENSDTPYSYNSIKLYNPPIKVNSHNEIAIHEVVEEIYSEKDMKAPWNMHL